MTQRLDLYAESLARAIRLDYKMDIINGSNWLFPLERTFNRNIETQNEKYIENIKGRSEVLTRFE